MEQGKQILVVDDHFAVLDSLRTMLQGASPAYRVIAVPSAEEGFLELGRTPCDLLITDIRLPGISGFELARRVRRLRPEIPIIMMTMTPSAPEREEAERLGVFRYLEKPLNTRTLLAAVESALIGNARPPVVVPARPERAPVDVQAGSVVETRLQILRTDTGASLVALVAKDGRIVCQLGDEPDQEMVQLATIAAASMRNGLELAIELESEEPVMIQYQAGERADLYTANVGAHFFVMLLFDARERRGRIGTIWVFAQRAIRELKEMLPAAPAPKPEAAPPRKTPSPQRPAPAKPELPPAPRRREPVPATMELSPPSRKNGTKSAPVTAADRAAERELAELLAGITVDQADELDAFWEEALDEAVAIPTEGLSFDEAIAQGLLPPTFGGAD
jgi:DNA-binding response OmpR family regulator